MQPLRSSEQNANEMTISSDRQVTTFFSATNYSPAISGNDHKAEASNIKEAESSLQENVSLNSEIMNKEAAANSFVDSQKCWQQVVKQLRD
nr:hypothetical protein [Tanacetum cinerariifolium]